MAKLFSTPAWPTEADALERLRALVEVIEATPDPAGSAYALIVRIMEMYQLRGVVFDPEDSELFDQASRLIAEASRTLDLAIAYQRKRLPESSDWDIPF